MYIHGCSSVLEVVTNLFPSLAPTTITRTPNIFSNDSKSFKLAGLSMGTPTS